MLSKYFCLQIPPPENRAKMWILTQNSPQWGCRMIQEIPFRHFLTTFRGKSTGNKWKKGEKIKALNWENKALFGGVTRKSQAPPVGWTGAEATELSTEMFWNMQRPKKHPELPKTLLVMQQNLPPEPKTTSPVGGKSQKPPKSTPRDSSINDIPFDRETLKDLVDFPLIFNKNKYATTEIPADLKKLPSVGRILQATMPEASREALMRWKVLKIAELGEEGFRKLNEQHLKQGAQLHRWIEEFLSTGGQVPEEARAEGGWRSVENFLTNIEAKCVEAKVAHPFLKYHGIVDCVSIVDSELHVIEWKKSERAKATISATYDAPLQLAAYLGALNATLPAHGLTTPVLRGAVVVVYTDGTPAHVHSLGSSEIRSYWRSWLIRLQEYWIRARDGTLPEPI